MAVTPISTTQQQSWQCLPCDWANKLCQAIHDFVMKMIKGIQDLFSTVPVAGRVGGAIGGALNLIPFYRGNEANNNGVTLDLILSWDDQRLEDVHNYIQWLFPLKTRSGPNPTAPILDQAVINTFRNDPQLKNQLLRSFRRMLSFYGLQMDESTKVITRSLHFPFRSASWLVNPAGHHNFLRISRIISSLNVLGLPDYSRAFFTIMQDIYHNEGRNSVPEATFRIWQSAAQ